MKRTKLILLFDADGCIFTNHLCRENQSRSSDAETYTVDDLWHAHPKLWAPISSIIYSLAPESIEILSASYRHSHALDRKYSQTKATGLFFPILPRLTELLQQIAPIDVQLDKTLFPDLLFKNKSGFEFENNNPSQNALLPNQLVQTWCFSLEKMKLVLLYALLQYLGKKHGPDAILNVVYFDAQMNRLSQLKDTFAHFARAQACIIPQNVKLSLCHYDGTERANLISEVTGQGFINESLSETLKEIILQIADSEARHQYNDDSNSRDPEETTLSRTIHRHLKDIHQHPMLSQSIPHTANYKELSEASDTPRQVNMHDYGHSRDLNSERVTEMTRCNQFSPMTTTETYQAKDNPYVVTTSEQDSPASSTHFQRDSFFKDATPRGVAQEGDDELHVKQFVIPETQKVESNCCFC